MIRKSASFCTKRPPAKSLALRSKYMISSATDFSSAFTNAHRKWSCFAAAQQSELEKRIQVQYKGAVVGDYDIDVLVDSCVAVEVKVAPQYDKRDEAQVLNELKATGLKVGLLVNFSRTKVEYKRLVF